jgi:hypothetical protein
MGPANDTKLGVHILPLAFPWTLAMIRKVATILGPATLSHLISERCWCMKNKIKITSGKQQASSNKQQAATNCRKAICQIDRATCVKVYNVKKI